MSEHTEHVVVNFPDDVLVRRGEVWGTTALTRQRAVSFGDWYVIECTGVESIGRDPDHNFDVGHNPTGLLLIGGMTFWEARRTAMAADDAGLSIERGVSYDTGCLIEAIVASALMDHYVYSLDRWLDAAHVDADHSHGINMCMTTEPGHN